MIENESNDILFVIVGDTTRVTFYNNDNPIYLDLDLKYITKKLSQKEQQVLLNNYLHVNKKKYKINVNKISATIPIYTTENKQYLRTLMEMKKKHNTTNGGIYFFSRVGFTPDSLYAILFYDYNCGGLCGWPAYCYLQKTNSGWVILSDHHLGIY